MSTQTNDIGYQNPFQAGHVIGS